MTFVQFLTLPVRKAGVFLNPLLDSFSGVTVGLEAASRFKNRQAVCFFVFHCRSLRRAESAVLACGPALPARSE